MKDRLWQRARVIFEQAVEMDESRQMAFVYKACGADQSLLDEVKRMVEADRRHNSLLDQPIFHWRVMTQTTHDENPGPLPFNYIGNYKLIRKLGEGGMGEVYLAIEEPVDRKVAIKLMRAGLGAEYLRRFNDERKALASLNQRNIVTMFTSNVAYDRHYFVMEYLEGESLRARMLRERIPPSEIVEITRQICEALNAAHNRGIVHRDIKPENIFLSRDDDGLLVKVLDFGIATLKESETRTVPSVIVGTAAYLSPEQARGLNRNEIDGRADIYAMGVVVYEMLTGALPFTAQDGAGYRYLHLNAMPQRPSERAIDVGITEAVSDVVMNALAKKPDDRYKTAREFAQTLKAASDAKEKYRYTPTLEETLPLPKKPAKVRYVLPLAAALLLLIGAGGWWAYRRINNTTVADNPTRQGPVGANGARPNNDSASGPNSHANLPGTTTAPIVTPSAAPLKPDVKVEIEQKGIGVVSSGKSFKSGESVRLIASPNQSGRVYIVMRGTSGPAEILYPDSRIKGSAAAVQANQRVEMPPSNSSSWFEIRGQPGVETLYVVFATETSEERLQSLESAIQQKRRQLNPTEEQQTLAALDALAGGQSAPPTVTAKKILLRHEK